MDLPAPLAWLVDEASASAGPDRFLAELGSRLLADGLPLAGGALALAVPHPIIACRTFLWRAETGGVIEALAFAGAAPIKAGSGWLTGLGPSHEEAVGADSVLGWAGVLPAMTKDALLLPPQQLGIGVPAPRKRALRSPGGQTGHDSTGRIDGQHRTQNPSLQAKSRASTSRFDRQAPGSRGAERPHWACAPRPRSGPGPTKGWPPSSTLLDAASGANTRTLGPPG